jgi:predicted O-methyltransferase YrrM
MQTFCVSHLGAPGHFYSPIPDREEIRQREDIIFERHPSEIPGICLNTDEQLRLLEEFMGFYKELPFTAEPTDGCRYFFNNDYYCHSDGIFLYSVIRYFKPRNIIEVGSGFSSLCILDTNEKFFDDSILCQFIEPYPERLLSQLKPGDLERSEITEKKLQDVDLDLFDRLGENDLLVIDSTHVTKTGSDVNRIFFEILPRLKKGVLIHFHDIFYPFEYPKEWVYEGRAWNEAYMLRSFLQYNNSFKIILFNTYLEQFFEEKFMSDFPLCLENRGGSFWLRKEC